MANFGQPIMMNMPNNFNNMNMPNNFNNMNMPNNFNNMNMPNNFNNMNMPNNFNNMNMLNNFNNMNGFSVAGFQNQNMNQMDSENLVAGNWSNMYTQNQPDLRAMNQKKSNGKITVVFKTGRGIITTIFIDKGKTVKYLIQVYFKRIGKPELFNRPLEIGFIYNARVIKFNESKLVEDFFKGNDYNTITVNDIGDLIGA